MLFFPYLEMHTRSWKQHSKHHRQQWTPSLFVFIIFPYLLVFSLSIAMLSIFGNVPYTLKTLPNIISYYDFSLIYFSFGIAIPSIFGNAHWILKTAPWTSSPTVSSIPLCFCDLSLFHSSSIATLSMFEAVHHSLKALPNIITNSEHHPLFFPVKFPLFYCYFSLAKAPISIWKWTLDPENSAQCCHQQWAPLLSSPMHPIALPEWLQWVQKNDKFFCWN